MIGPALAAYIITSLNIFRKTYLSSYLIGGVVIVSYFCFLTTVGLAYSSYFLMPLFSLSSFGTSILKPDSMQESTTEATSGTGPRVATYSRVSSSKQVKGQSLEVQEECFEKMKQIHKPRKVYKFSDPGKSGLDFDKRKIIDIMKLAEDRLIDELWITWINRLGRNCRKLLLFCLNLCEEGVTIRTPEKQYDLRDLSSLLMLAIEANEAEKENKRRAKTARDSKARLFRLKKWNKPIPLGFTREGNWLKKKVRWRPLIKDTYVKLTKGASLKAVRKFINAKYKDLLPNPLTCSQVRRLLSDPVYSGRAQHLGVIVEDSALSFVSLETFETVQKILCRISSKHKPKGEDTIRKLVGLYGIAALDFLEQIDFVHKSCGGVIRKNGVRVYGGVCRRLFDCKKCKRQWIVPTDHELKKIQAHFVKKEQTFNRFPNSNSAKYEMSHPQVISSKNISKLKERQKFKPNNKKFHQQSMRKSFEQTHLDYFNVHKK